MKERFEQYGRDFAVRQRARDRLPAWLKAVVVPTILLSVFGSAIVLMFVGMGVHDWLHPGLSQNRVPEPVIALVFVASVATALAPGLILANCLLWTIPPLRRALQRNAIGAPGGSFHAANRGLLKVARFSVPIGLVIWAAAAIDPWQ